MKKLLLWLLLAAMPSLAQYVRVDPIPVLTVTPGTQGGAYPVVLAIPGAVISASTQTYSGGVGAVACPSTAPVVLNATNTCVGTSDAQGNFGFWVAPGITFTYTETIGGQVFGPYSITAPALGAPNTFNVKTYGAVCDGTTDDAAAIRAALADAQAAALSTASLPFPVSPLVVGGTAGKQCAVGSEIRVPSNLNLQLNVVALPSLGSSNLFTVVPGFAGSLGGSMTDMSVNGAGSASTGSLVELIDSTNYTIAGVTMAEHGGRCLVNDNSERMEYGLNNLIIACRKPITMFSGGNESRLVPKVLDYGIVDAIGSAPAASYSINSNANNVYPAPNSGPGGTPTVLTPDNYRAAVVIDGPDTVYLDGPGSIKGSPDMPGLLVRGSIVSASNLYLEQSHITTSTMVGGGYVYAKGVAAFPPTAYFVQVDNVDWQNWYNGSCSDTLTYGFPYKVGARIFPPDYLPGSSAASTIGGGVLRGMSESASLGGFCKDNPNRNSFFYSGNGTTIGRGLQGGCSNPPSCTAYAAINWPAGFLVSESTPSATSVLRLKDSHIAGIGGNGPSAGYIVQPDNSTTKTYAEIAVGNIPDGFTVQPSIQGGNSVLILGNSEIFNSGDSALARVPAIGLIWGHTNATIDITDESFSDPAELSYDNPNASINIRGTMIYGPGRIGVANYANGVTACVNVIDAQGGRSSNSCPNGTIATQDIAPPDPASNGSNPVRDPGKSYVGSYSLYGRVKPLAAPVPVVNATGGAIPPGNYEARYAYVESTAFPANGFTGGYPNATISSGGGGYTLGAIVSIAGAASDTVAISSVTTASPNVATVVFTGTKPASYVTGALLTLSGMTATHLDQGLNAQVLTITGTTANSVTGTLLTTVANQTATTDTGSLTISYCPYFAQVGVQNGLGQINAIGDLGMTSAGRPGYCTVTPGTVVNINFSQPNSGAGAGAAGSLIVQGSYGLLSTPSVFSVASGSTNSIGIPSPPAEPAGGLAASWNAYVGPPGNSYFYGNYALGTTATVTTVVAAPQNPAQAFSPADCAYNCYPESRLLSYDTGASSGIKVSKYNLITSSWADFLKVDSIAGTTIYDRFGNPLNGCLQQSGGAGITGSGGACGTAGVNSIVGPSATATGTITFNGAVTQSGNTFTVTGGGGATLPPASHLVASTSSTTGVTATANDVGAVTYVADTGTANAYVATLNPPVTSLNSGLTLKLDIANSSTGASTLAVNGLAATAILKKSPTGLVAIAANDLVAGQVYTFEYDGSVFQTSATSASGGANGPVSSLQTSTTGATNAPLSGTYDAVMDAYNKASFKALDTQISVHNFVVNPNWTFNGGSTACSFGNSTTNNTLGFMSPPFTGGDPLTCANAYQQYLASLKTGSTCSILKGSAESYIITQPIVLPNYGNYLCGILGDGAVSNISWQSSSTIDANPTNITAYQIDGSNNVTFTVGSGLVPQRNSIVVIGNTTAGSTTGLPSYLVGNGSTTGGQRMIVSANTTTTFTASSPIFTHAAVALTSVTGGTAEPLYMLGMSGTAYPSGDPGTTGPMALSGGASRGGIADLRLNPKYGTQLGVTLNFGIGSFMKNVTVGGAGTLPSNMPACAYEINQGYAHNTTAPNDCGANFWQLGADLKEFQVLSQYDGSLSSGNSAYYFPILTGGVVSALDPGAKLLSATCTSNCTGFTGANPGWTWTNNNLGNNIPCYAPPTGGSTTTQTGATWTLNGFSTTSHGVCPVDNFPTPILSLLGAGNPQPSFNMTWGYNNTVGSGGNTALAPIMGISANCKTNCGSYTSTPTVSFANGGGSQLCTAGLPTGTVTSVNPIVISVSVPANSCAILNPPVMTVSGGGGNATFDVNYYNTGGYNYSKNTDYGGGPTLYGTGSNPNSLASTPLPDQPCDTMPDISLITSQIGTSGNYGVSGYTINSSANAGYMIKNENAAYSSAGGVNCAPLSSSNGTTYMDQGLFFQVVDLPQQMAFDTRNNASDMSAEDFRPGGGAYCGWMNAGGSGLVTGYHWHPYWEARAMCNQGGSVLLNNLEVDTVRIDTIECGGACHMNGVTRGDDGNGPDPGAAFLHIVSGSGRAARIDNYQSGNVQGGGGFTFTKDYQLGIFNAQTALPDPGIQCLDCDDARSIGQMSHSNYFKVPTYFNTAPIFAPLGLATATTTFQNSQTPRWSFNYWNGAANVNAYNIFGTNGAATGTAGANTYNNVQLLQFANSNANLIADIFQINNPTTTGQYAVPPANYLAPMLQLSWNGLLSTGLTGGNYYNMQAESLGYNGGDMYFRHYASQNSGTNLVEWWFDGAKFALGSTAGGAISSDTVWGRAPGGDGLVIGNSVTDMPFDASGHMLLRQIQFENWPQQNAQVTVSSQAPSFVVTGAATASGGNTTYTGTFTNGDNNGYLGWPVTITGLDALIDVGSFTATASTATTLTVNNAFGVADTPAAIPVTSVAPQFAAGVYAPRYAVYQGTFPISAVVAGADLTFGGFANAGNNCVKCQVIGNTPVTGPATAITGFSITGNQITFNDTNTYSAGNQVVVAGLTNAYANGPYYITAATGSTFTASISHANVGSTTDAGTAVPNTAYQVTVINPNAVAETATATATALPTASFNVAANSGGGKGIVIDAIGGDTTGYLHPDAAEPIPCPAGTNNIGLDVLHTLQTCTLPPASNETFVFPTAGAYTAGYKVTLKIKMPSTGDSTASFSGVTDGANIHPQTGANASTEIQFYWNPTSSSWDTTSTYTFAQLGGVCSIAQGCTGAATAAGALTNLGAASASSLSTYAPLASPALTGTPTAPTATAGTNTTQIATTGFVQTAINAVSNATTAPAWLQYLGTGVDGAYSLTTGSANLSGDKYYTSFNVSAGATLTVNNSTGLTIHSQGACTIAGTINARGIDGAGNGVGGGAPGGSGGGTLAGSTRNSYISPAGTGTGGVSAATGGGAGAASGGSATSNGTAPSGTIQRGLLSNGWGLDFLYGGGASGTAGGNNASGLLGLGGGEVTFICGSINGAGGSVDVSGTPGGPSTGNNVGSNAPGGSGIVVFSSQAASPVLPTVYLAPASGSPVTVPAAMGWDGSCTTPVLLTLAVSGGALSGTPTIVNAGANCGTGTNMQFSILGGGGTQGTGAVSCTFSGGSATACTETPGTSSGYTAATYTGAGASSNSGSGWTASFSGW